MRFCHSRGSSSTMYDNTSIHGASYSFNDVTFGTKRSNSLLSNKKNEKGKNFGFSFSGKYKFLFVTKSVRVDKKTNEIISTPKT